MEAEKTRKKEEIRARGLDAFRRIQASFARETPLNEQQEAFWANEVKLAERRERSNRR